MQVDLAYRACYSSRVPSELDIVTRALAAHRRAKAQADKTLTAVYDAIRVARAAGVPQSELVKITSYTREHIRQITKD